MNAKRNHAYWPKGSMVALKRIHAFSCCWCEKVELLIQYPCTWLLVLGSLYLPGMVSSSNSFLPLSNPSSKAAQQCMAFKPYLANVLCSNMCVWGVGRKGH